MSSTKSATGHLLGAAGAIEAIFWVLAIRDQVAPPTINLENPSVETAIDLAPHEGGEARRSTWCCRTRSASAAPTPRWCCGGWREAAAMMRHVAANALTLLIVVLVVVFGIVTWAQRQYPGAGAADRRRWRSRSSAARAWSSVADKLAEAGAIAQRDDVPHRGALRRARCGAAVRRLQHPGRGLDAGDPRAPEPRRQRDPAGRGAGGADELAGGRDAAGAAGAERGDRRGAAGGVAGAGGLRFPARRRAAGGARADAGGAGGDPGGGLGGAGAGPAAGVAGGAADAGLDRREGDRGARRSGRWSPRCSSTGCGGACGCRPTRR